MNEKEYTDVMKQQKRSLEKLLGSEVEYEYCEQEKGMINIPNDKPDGKVSLKERSEVYARLVNSKKFMNILGFNNKDLYVIPTREKGLTGSGQFGKCHENVASLVTRFGGKRVYGYVLEEMENENAKGETVRTEVFIGHSVWETPEGKLVDVTWGNTPFARKYYFIPLMKTTPASRKTIVEMGDFLCMPDKRIYDSSADEKYRYANQGKSMDEELLNDTGLIKPIPYKTLKLFVKKEFYKLHNYIGDEWRDYSEFSQPSMGTGKKFNEIPPKEEYKKIYDNGYKINPNGIMRSYLSPEGRER